MHQSDIEIEQTYTPPLSVFGVNYAVLQSFYQYSFPPEKLSPQSWKIDQYLSDTQLDELYNRILNSLELNARDFLFDPFLKNKIKDIQAMGLSDSTLTIDRRKGFSQQTNATSTRKGEHKVVALSRRFRDSFAHGRVKDCGDSWVLFEDKAQKQITGRIVLKKNDLMTLKSVIIEYLDELGISHT